MLFSGWKWAVAKWQICGLEFVLPGIFSKIDWLHGRGPIWQWSPPYITSQRNCISLRDLSKFWNNFTSSDPYWPDACSFYGIISLVPIPVTSCWHSVWHFILHSSLSSSPNLCFCLSFSFCSLSDASNFLLVFYLAIIVIPSKIFEIKINWRFNSDMAFFVKYFLKFKNLLGTYFLGNMNWHFLVFGDSILKEFYLAFHLVPKSVIPCLLVFHLQLLWQVLWHLMCAFPLAFQLAISFTSSPAF